MEQKYKKSIAKKPKLEPEFKESIAERNMLREQRLSEIAKKEKTINNNFFKDNLEYSSPSNMYKNLNTTADIEENKIKVNKINNLADLVMKIKNNPTNNTKKIRNRNNMVEIVKLILKFNQPEQGSGLKILHQTKCSVDYKFL